MDGVSYQLSTSLPYKQSLHGWDVMEEKDQGRFDQQPDGEESIPAAILDLQWL